MKRERERGRERGRSRREKEKSEITGKQNFNFKSSQHYQKKRHYVCKIYNVLNNSTIKIVQPNPKLFLRNSRTQELKNPKPKSQ